MNFYNYQHNFYWGIDLHAKTMYIYILRMTLSLPWNVCLLGIGSLIS
jgi:hypothetical protein